MQINLANKAFKTKIFKAVQNIRQGTGPAEECNSLKIYVKIPCPKGFS